MINGHISHYTSAGTGVILSVSTNVGTSAPILILNKGTDELTIQSKYAESGIRLHPEIGYYYKETSQEYYRILHKGYLQAIGVDVLKHTDKSQTMSLHSINSTAFMRIGPAIFKDNVYQIAFAVGGLQEPFPLAPVNPDTALPVMSRKYTYANGTFTAVDSSISLGAVSEMRNLVTSTHVNNFLRTRQMYGILLIDLVTKEETYLVHENKEVFTMCAGTASEGEVLVATTLDDIITQTETFIGTPV